MFICTRWGYGRSTKVRAGGGTKLGRFPVCFFRKVICLHLHLFGAVECILPRSPNAAHPGCRIRLVVACFGVRSSPTPPNRPTGTACTSHHHCSTPDTTTNLNISPQHHELVLHTVLVLYILYDTGFNKINKSKPNSCRGFPNN